MTIGNSTIVPDATSYGGTSGGTGVAISLLKSAGLTKVTAKYDDDTDFLTRTLMEFSVKDPVVQSTAPGGYTQARETVFVKKPMTLANGNRTVNTINITISRDPEMTEADLLAFRLEATQLIGLSSLDDFYLSHSLN